MNKRNIWGHIMTLITIIIWGTTFISTKILLRDLHPAEVLICRFLVAYCALTVIYPKFHRIKSWKEELLFFGAGASGVTLYFLVENIALGYTLVSNVGLLVSAAPITTAILAHLYTRDERFNLNLIIGLIVAFSGVFLVIFNGNFILEINPLGDFLAVLAACIWSVYTMLLKKLGNQYNIIYTTRKIFFYGLLAAIPVPYLFNLKFEFVSRLTPGIAAHLLFLGLAASALCFVLWNTAVGILGVVKTSNYIYLVPLITIVTAYLVLGERMTGIAVAGAVLILSGIYISEKGFGRIVNLFTNKTKVTTELTND